METKPTLGYWNIRGHAEPIRYLLRYLNIDYNEVSYVIGPVRFVDISNWSTECNTLGLDFPNLPYYLDGDIRISESLAIMQHVSEKHRPELLGRTLKDKATVSQLGGVISDIKNYLVNICYDPEFENLIVEGFKNSLVEVKKVAKFLGEKNFLIGDYVTWVDFFWFETIEMVEALKEGTLREIGDVLVAYRNRVAALNGMEASISGKRMPWNGASAKWL